MNGPRFNPTNLVKTHTKASVNPLKIKETNPHDRLPKRRVQEQKHKTKDRKHNNLQHAVILPKIFVRHIVQPQLIRVQFVQELRLAPMCSVQPIVVRRIIARRHVQPHLHREAQHAVLLLVPAVRLRGVQARAEAAQPPNNQVAQVADKYGSTIIQL